MPKLKTFGEKAFRGQKLLVGNFDFSLSAITELPYYAFVDDEKQVDLSDRLLYALGGEGADSRFNYGGAVTRLPV